MVVSSPVVLFVMKDSSTQNNFRCLGHLINRCVFGYYGDSRCEFKPRVFCGKLITYNFTPTVKINL